MSEKKMVNVAKSLDMIAKTCVVVFRVFAVVFFVFAVLVLILGNKMYEAGSFTLDLDFVKFYLADQYQTASVPLQIFTIVSLVVVGGLCLAGSYVLKLLRDILQPMKEGRPFEESVPKKDPTHCMDRVGRRLSFRSAGNCRARCYSSGIPHRTDFFFLCNSKNRIHLHYGFWFCFNLLCHHAFILYFCLWTEAAAGI